MLRANFVKGILVIVTTERLKQAAKWALLAAVTVAVTIPLTMVGVPSAALFAALIVGIALALPSLAPARMPRPVGIAAQGVLGVYIGTMVHRDAVSALGPDWPIVPGALTDVLVDFHSRYGDRLPPIIIAENGASFPEPDSVTAPIDDVDRIEYLAGHIAAVERAREQGVRIDEYTVWSLLDNFEWAEGFTQRFGLVHVHHTTGDRTPKASFDWYRTLIEEARS